GAELFNRTESQVSIEGSSTIVTNTNNRRNIPAGILEGGLKSVVPQIAQRNQQAISQMMQRTNVWFIPAGKEVEIYVNRTMQL
ncbi:TrbI/VirB10 family protein, partial [Nodularia spumigena CS-591/04]